MVVGDVSGRKCLCEHVGNATGRKQMILQVRYRET